MNIHYHLEQSQGIAVYEYGKEFSYADLNTKSLAIKSLLEGFPVLKNTVVAILTEKGFNFTASMLGVVRHGATYLPLDATYPVERLLYMFKDSDSVLVLTDTENEALAKQISTKTLVIDDALQCSNQTSWPNNPDHYVYMIYTSGTTGVPKGVKIRYDSLTNFLGAQESALNVTDSSVFAELASPCFDMSVWEHFLPLHCGGSVVTLKTQDTIDGVLLQKRLIENKVSHILITPTMLSIIPYSNVTSLQYIISAGEKCSLEQVQSWGVQRNFYDAYGATEATVFTTMRQCKPSDQELTGVGTPMQNTNVYVLDDNDNKVYDCIGEIVITGIGVAEGYHKRDELNASKFFTLCGDNAYRTGDLGYLTQTGSLIFKGRSDRQVKLNGFRIELEEIEAKANQIPGVDLTHAVFVKGQFESITLYVKPIDMDAQRLKNELRKTLPKHMIPSNIVGVSQFSMTGSGKIDISKLVNIQGVEHEQH